MHHMLCSWLKRMATSWRQLAVVVGATAPLLAACGGGNSGGFDLGFSPGDLLTGSSQPAGPQQPTASIGSGNIKVGFILPLTATGNAGVAALSMRNAAEMALAEFNVSDLQLLVKDDAGTAQGAQQAAQQALDEGAEIILGPLFAHSVAAVGQVARARNIPVIAFSTDANVAARGVHLLSFLPESDVDRIVSYAMAQGKRSFVAAMPDNAYGTVVEAAFKQTVARRGGRLAALERYPAGAGQIQTQVRSIVQASSRADAIFIPDGAESVTKVVQALVAARLDTRRVQLLGSGLWEDPQIFSSQVMDGAWYAGPDATGFRNFSGRYRTRYGQDPARTASLAYDAVALVAALSKTQGSRRFAEDVLTNASGFTGIDGLFRFRRDGTNQRGLAVMRVTPTGGQIISPAPKSFGGTPGPS
jgi:ABC-type branched-subunit amino acid transport system substrate-binding protein